MQPWIETSVWFYNTVQWIEIFWKYSSIRTCIVSSLLPELVRIRIFHSRKKKYFLFFFGSPAKSSLLSGQCKWAVLLEIEMATESKLLLLKFCCGDSGDGTSPFFSSLSKARASSPDAIEPKHFTTKPKLLFYENWNHLALTYSVLPYKTGSLSFRGQSTVSHWLNRAFKPEPRLVSSIEDSFRGFSEVKLIRNLC